MRAVDSRPGSRCASAIRRFSDKHCNRAELLGMVGDIYSTILMFQTLPPPACHSESVFFFFLVALVLLLFLLGVGAGVEAAVSFFAVSVASCCAMSGAGAGPRRP